MRIPRIYTAQALNEGTLTDLEESPSRHLSKVLRMQAGSQLVLFNGQGCEYSATIETVNKKSVSVNVLERFTHNRESTIKTHLAIGLSRGERFDFVLQKACELGVHEITPLFTDRTEVKIPKERMQKKSLSWQQIVISSCEQNQRNIIPVIHPAQNIQDFLNTLDAPQLENEQSESLPGENDLRLVLHHRTSQKLSDHQAPSKVTLLVGPEGGLNDDEILLAEAKHFNALALGPRVLRTETAPIAALSCIQLLWGDF